MQKLLCDSEASMERAFCFIIIYYTAISDHSCLIPFTFVNQGYRNSSCWAAAPVHISNTKNKDGQIKDPVFVLLEPNSFLHNAATVLICGVYLLCVMFSVTSVSTL